MKFEAVFDELTGTTRFYGEVTQADLDRLALSSLDWLILTDPPKSAADHLLSLELIFRRSQEQEGKDG